MRAELINPFIVNALTVMRKTMRVDATQGRPKVVADKESLTHEVTVGIGLTGGVRGDVVLGMNSTTARQVASTMLLGVSIEEMDEMAQSALCELVNIIVGNATIDLSGSGVDCRITLPRVDFNASVAPVDGLKTLAIPIQSPLGEIRLDINAR